jgi:hypothetical protein
MPTGSPRWQQLRRWRPRNHAGAIAAPLPQATLAGVRVLWWDLGWPGSSRNLINYNDDFVFNNYDHPSLLDCDNDLDSVFNDDDFLSLFDWDRAWIDDPLIWSVTEFEFEGRKFGF